MGGRTDSKDRFEQLRAQAEALIRERPGDTLETPSDIMELIHELQIHQAELEIQNEELQRAQGEISALQREYEDLYEFAPCGYLTLNRKGIITRINLTGVKLLGNEKKRVFRQPLSRFIDEGYEDGFLLARKKSAETGEKQSVEVPLKRQNSSTVWVRADIEADRDKNDAVIQWRVTLMDITGQKKAQEDMRESKEKYRSLFNSIRDAILVADTDRKIIGCNSAFTELFGYSEKDILGKKTRYVYESDAQFNEMGERLKENMDNPNFLYRINYRKKSGDIFPGETNVFYLRDAEGKLSGFIGLIRDVTEQRMAEEERDRLQSQLRQAQKLEAIGTLSGGIAHDFNNILSIILGNTELAMGDVPEWSPARNNLKEVRKACDRAKDIIQQILSFSRKAESEMRPVNIGPIIKESIKFLRASIPTSIEIRHNILADLKSILGDPTQIHQVLLNLCTNAAHAMEEGGVLGIELTDLVLNEKDASRYSDVDHGRYVKLVVKDTGHGMTPDVIDRIFDPYFTTKEAGKGTGMGLAVVHGIVKSHAGSISVTSTPGEGTTVEILFPVVEEEVTAEAPQMRESLPYGHERILFVDDEAALVRLNEQRLAHLGYQVESRTDPLEALELFRSDPRAFDLIITDTTMPHMTGDRLAQEIMKIRPGISILLCTGYSDRVDKDKAKEMGISGFAMKPIDMGELAKTVRRLLDTTGKDS